LLKVTPTETVESVDPVALAKARQAWTTDCLTLLKGDQHG